MTITWSRSRHWGLWTPGGLLSGTKGREGIGPPGSHQAAPLVSVSYSVLNNDYDFT